MKLLMNVQKDKIKRMVIKVIQYIKQTIRLLNNLENMLNFFLIFVYKMKVLFIKIHVS